MSNSGNASQLQEGRLLAKAEPINEGGSASGVKYFRKEEKSVQGQLRSERGVRKRSLQTPTSVQKEGEKVLQSLPCSLWCKCWRGSCALTALEAHCGAKIHLQPMDDPVLEQVDAQRVV
ncbi:hypothetical protein WISP_132382 [Willisornis vidua]|uniref:Uncharacterized protein n=1 Tax=Willisornis vidua TaxID=1566151 RepID=A0ABQ9CV46_9PASS|nr:hypothetical protein WISP_132382 [Willisornis vidua]